MIPRNNTAVAQILIQWTNAPPEDTTWEDYYDIAARFPNFDPWGQGSASAGGNVTNTGEIGEIRASMGKKWDEFQKKGKMRGKFRISQKKLKEEKYFEDKWEKSKHLNRSKEIHVAQSEMAKEEIQEGTMHN